MGSRNLGTVLSPTVLYPKDPNVSTMVDDMERATHTFTLMIDEFQNHFSSYLVGEGAVPPEPTKNLSVVTPVPSTNNLPAASMPRKISTGGRDIPPSTTAFSRPSFSKRLATANHVSDTYIPPQPLNNKGVPGPDTGDANHLFHGFLLCFKCFIYLQLLGDR